MDSTQLKPDVKLSDFLAELEAANTQSEVEILVWKYCDEKDIPALWALVNTITAFKEDMRHIPEPRVRHRPAPIASDVKIFIAAIVAVACMAIIGWSFSM